jgi:long-chain fatty acid transport protein
MLVRLLATLLVLATPLCATNGLRQIGRGVKSKGMGGTGIANPQSAFSQAANPANLMSLHNRIDGDLFWVEQRGENLWWPEVAARIGWWGNQALGGAIYIYGDSKTESARHGALFFSPAWAWRINQCHTFGIAVNFALEWFEKSGRILDQPSVHPGRVANQGRDVEWGINARFGWIGTLHSRLKLGLTYQTTTIVSQIRKYRGFLPGGGELHLPQEFGAGASWKPWHCLTLALDVLELFWRDSLYYRNGRSSAPLGSNHGPGLGWSNQTVVKVGLAWNPLPYLTLRGGYNHGNSPIPSNNPLDVLEPMTCSDHATAGLTYALGFNELSLAYIHGFRHYNSVGIAYGRLF